MLGSNLDGLAQQLRSRLERNLDMLDGVLRDYVESGELLEEVGAAAREMIVERTTERRVDAGGRPFAPYSPGYAKWKARRFGHAGAPNLRLSGRMLGEITLKRDAPLAGRLSFAGTLSARIAAYHQGGRGRLPRRAFFGIRPGSAEAARLMEVVAREFERRLGGGRGR